MIYWVFDAETGRRLHGYKTHEEAVAKQDKLWSEDHIDTVIMKEE